MSYIDLIYANNYIGIDFYAKDIWSALDDINKQSLIDNAMKILESQIWIGEKTDPMQLEQFPRSYQKYYIKDPVAALNYYLAEIARRDQNR